MSNQLLQPDASQQKIITLTQSKRWASILRNQTPAIQRVAAIDLDDVAYEATRWSESVAIVEVNKVNLVPVCRFSLLQLSRLSKTPLFAVTNLGQPDVSNTLAIAGFLAICRSPLAVERFYRQISAVQRLRNGSMLPIESNFRQRLPWRPLDRYAGSQFDRTAFSSPPDRAAFTVTHFTDSTHQ